MRVTSQQLRQFVVVQDGTLDPYILAENVALFNADGTPLEGIETTDDARALVWRGAWAEGTAYNKFDVVTYDPGSDPAVYIFNENVPVSDYLFETYPLDDFLTEDSFPVTMVIDESISRSDNLSGEDNPFRAYGIKIVEAGQLHLSTAPDDAARDMMAVLFRLDDDGVTWNSVASGDDEAGSGHPAINTAVTPGTYLFAFTIFGGDDPDRYGSSTLTLGESNTAVLGTWDAVAFPVDSVIRLVAEGGGSRLPPGGDTGEFLAKASAADGDAEWVPPPEGGGGGSGGGGVQFFGEWEPGSYPEQSMVTHDDKLWVANEAIDVGAFEFVASDWTSQFGGSDTISIPVPAETEVGDILIWCGFQMHYAMRQRPSDYVNWTLLHSDGFVDETYPPGHVELYAKVATAEDLGTDKVCTENPGQSGAVQLLVFRNAGMPIDSEVDASLFRNDSYGSAFNIAPGADPVEVDTGDKVLRLFSAAAQNLALDSGNNPSFSSGADAQDELIFDVREIIGGGSYWADADSSDLPQFNWSSGEHRYVVRYIVRLPSIATWDETKWTLAGGSAASDAMVWAGEWDSDESYSQNDVVTHESAIYSAPVDMEAGNEPVEIPIEPVRSSHVNVFSNYTFANTPILRKDVPFTDISSAPSSGGNLWMSGSRLVSFDADPGSDVTITTVGGQFVPYRDTGASSSSNSELIGSAHGYNSPQTFAAPAEGMVTVEIASTVTSITISGDGVAEADPAWELIAFLGAKPVSFLYEATQYNTMSGAFTYAGTQEIVVPSDGDYEISMSASLGSDNTTASNRCEAGPAVNGSVDAGLTAIRSAASGAAYAVTSCSVGDRVLSLNEGDIIRPMFRQVGGSLVYIEQIKIAVRPVTVA